MELPDTITRLKYLRKEVLKLNQSDFAETIHISQPQYSLLEKSQRSLTARTFSDICREFNVNKKWLSNGEGEIFNKTNFDFFSLTEKEQVVLNAYSAIPEKERLQLFHFLESLINNIDYLNETSDAS